MEINIKSNEGSTNFFNTNGIEFEKALQAFVFIGAI